MKKMFVGFAMFMAMFLMVSCGGGENGCKTFYECINSCYNDAHSSDYCYEDCQSVASHEDLVNYQNYSYCKEDWEDAREDGKTTQMLKDYCSGEMKKCGL